MHRLLAINSQIGATTTPPVPVEKGKNHYKVQPSPNDVVICCALRTPITKANKGGLATVFGTTLLSTLTVELLKRTKNLRSELIEDACIGNVLAPGAALIDARMGLLLGGLPVSLPVYSVNRFCASGLQAVASVAAQITAGDIELGLAGGFESMTHFSMQNMVDPDKLSSQVFQHQHTQDCLIPMGLTSENIARQFLISREAQDEFAAASHAKAHSAQMKGLFQHELVPVPLEDGSIVTRDDGIRPDTSVTGLSQLKPSFASHGSTTAGNSSQVSDGAALCLLAKRSTAERMQLPILAKFVAFNAVGVPPAIMGIGPAAAIPAVLKDIGLTISDIDIFEINEAFASQACYCINTLQIPNHKVNPNGGAIALGHPLGATGARQIATLLPELKRRKARYGVVSLCIGTGMGAAAVIENLQLS